MQCKKFDKRTMKEATSIRFSEIIMILENSWYFLVNDLPIGVNILKTEGNITLKLYMDDFSKFNTFENSLKSINRENVYHSNIELLTHYVYYPIVKYFIRTKINSEFDEDDMFKFKLSIMGNELTYFLDLDNGWQVGKRQNEELK